MPVLIGTTAHFPAPLLGRTQKAQRGSGRTARPESHFSPQVITPAFGGPEDLSPGGQDGGLPGYFIALPLSRPRLGLSEAGPCPQTSREPAFAGREMQRGSPTSEAT